MGSPLSASAPAIRFRWDNRDEARAAVQAVMDAHPDGAGWVLGGLRLGPERTVVCTLSWTEHGTRRSEDVAVGGIAITAEPPC